MRWGDPRVKQGVDVHVVRESRDGLPPLGWSISPSSSVTNFTDYQSCISGSSTPDDLSPLTSPRNDLDLPSQKRPSIAEEESPTPARWQREREDSASSPAMRMPLTQPTSLVPLGPYTKAGGVFTRELEAVYYPLVFSSTAKGHSHHKLLQPDERLGDGHSASVVMVHGFMESSRDMMALAQRLVDERACRVLLIDLYGFGASQPPTGLAQHISPSMYLSQIQDKLLEVGWYRERVILVGKGMGASLCLQHAAARPESVAKVVLIDPACFLGVWAWAEGVCAWVLGTILRVLLQCSALWFYVANRAFALVRIPIPDMVSHLTGFATLLRHAPTYALTDGHTKAARRTPIVVARTPGGLLSFLGLTGNASDAGLLTAVGVIGDARSAGLYVVQECGVERDGGGLERRGDLWCVEEWFSDGEDAGDLREVVSRADAMYREGAFEECLIYLEKVSETLPSPTNRRHVEVLWRLARAYFEVACRDQELTEAQSHQVVAKGLATAFCALQTDSSSAAAHIWYGVLLAKVGEYEGPKATILNSFEVREHFTRAAQINSSDAVAHFLLGSWCLEVASISPVTRWWSSSLYADPPIATHQEALDHFLKAEACDPQSENSIRNRMGIVRCCLALKRREQAVKWLDRLVLMEATKEEDERVLADALRMRRELA